MNVPAAQTIAWEDGKDIGARLAQRCVAIVEFFEANHADPAVVEEIKADIGAAVEMLGRCGPRRPRVVNRYSPVSDEITTILSRSDRPLTSAEIAAAMGKATAREKNSVQCVISKLLRRGIVGREGRLLHLLEPADPAGDDAKACGDDEADADEDEPAGEKPPFDEEPPGPLSMRLGSIGALKWLDGVHELVELVVKVPAHLRLVSPIDDGLEMRSADAIRSSRKREVRKQTVNLQRISKKFLEAERALYPAPSPEQTMGRLARPKVRAECEGVARPCPFVSCAHNLYLDVQKNGSITLNFPDLEPSEMAESCALDVAERGGSRLEDVGAFMNMTRERVRQLEIKALSKLAALPHNVLKEFSGCDGKPTRKLHLSIVRPPPAPAPPPPRPEEDPESIEISLCPSNLVGGEP